MTFKSTARSLLRERCSTWPNSYFKDESSFPHNIEIEFKYFMYSFFFFFLEFKYFKNVFSAYCSCSIF